MKILFYSKREKVVQHFKKRVKAAECVVVSSYEDLLEQIKSTNILFIDYDAHKRVFNKLIKDKVDVIKIIVSKKMKVKEIKDHQKSDSSADGYLTLPVDAGLLTGMIEDFSENSEVNKVKPDTATDTNSGIIEQTIKEYQVQDRTLNNLDSTLNKKIQEKFDSSVLKSEERLDLLDDSIDNEESKTDNDIGQIAVEFEDDEGDDGLDEINIDEEENEEVVEENSAQFEIEQDVLDDVDIEFTSDGTKTKETYKGDIKANTDSDFDETLNDASGDTANLEIDFKVNASEDTKEIKAKEQTGTDLNFSTGEDLIDDDITGEFEEFTTSEEIDLDKEFDDGNEGSEFSSEDESDLIEIEKTIVDERISEDKSGTDINPSTEDDALDIEKTIIDERDKDSSAATVMVDKNSQKLEEDEATVLVGKNEFGSGVNGLFQDENAQTEIGKVNVEALEKEADFPIEMKYKKAEEDEEEKTTLVKPDFQSEKTFIVKDLGKTEINELVNMDNDLLRYNQDEYLRLQSTIRVLREDRDKLISENEQLNKQKQEYDQQNLSTKAELEDLKIELSIVKKRNMNEIEEMNYKLKISEEKKAIIEEKFKRSSDEINVLNNKVRIDLQAIKQREKELESQLELVTMDSAAQVQSRDNKILELKRKIDSLEFNMENLVIREQKYREDKRNLEDRMQKIMRTLRGSISILEDDMNIDEEILKKIKDL